jgi:hypothetical protein
MKANTLRGLLILTPALLALTPLLQAQSVQSPGVDPAAPGGRLATPGDEFVLELRVEPLAGESVSAEGLQITFFPVEPPVVVDAMFANGFEPN